MVSRIAGANNFALLDPKHFLTDLKTGAPLFRGEVVIKKDGKLDRGRVYSMREFLIFFLKKKSSELFFFHVFFFGNFIGFK